MKLFILLILFVIPTFAIGANEHDSEIFKLVLEELNEVKQSLTSLENTVVVLENTVGELENTVVVLENTVGELKNTVGELENTVAQLTHENAELKAEMKELRANEKGEPRHVALPRGIQKRQVVEKVAFTVGVSVLDLNNLGLHQTVVFDRALSNVGGAFHTNSGMFLAPLRGYYGFTLTMMVSPNKDAYLDIVIDGNAVNYIYAASAGSYASTTKQWIIEVNKGSEVWIRARNANSDIHGGMHTLFSGFMLFPTE